MELKLFSVSCILNNYIFRNRVYYGLPQQFYVVRNYPVLPYSKAIQGYIPEDSSSKYSEDALNGLFTEVEVEILGKYLKDHTVYERFETELIVKEVDLPIPNDMGCPSAFGTGGGDVNWEVWMEDGYDLPFKYGAHMYLPDAKSYKELPQKMYKFPF